jgi:predicted DsbA family dithiol-disulfide isomerase
MESRLVVFADYVCPYCYLSDLGVARLRREGVETEVGAFELWPPGTSLPTGREAWLAEAWERSVLPLARAAGVSVERATLMTRTRKAHEAVAYARSAGARDAMHEAVYHAYWQERRDIGRIDVLVEIAGAVGLDRTDVKVALDIDQWTARVEQDIAAAAHLRLSGVPSYLLLQDGSGEVRTGMQHYDELREWVKN